MLKRKLNFVEIVYCLLSIENTRFNGDLNNSWILSSPIDLARSLGVSPKLFLIFFKSEIFTKNFTTFSWRFWTATCNALFPFLSTRVWSQPEKIVQWKMFCSVHKLYTRVCYTKLFKAKIDFIQCRKTRKKPVDFIPNLKRASMICTLPFPDARWIGLELFLSLPFIYTVI